MASKLITAPTTLPVTLVEAKLHLRVDINNDDDLITAMITAASEMAEQLTGRALMTQTWEVTLDAFPDAVELNRVPAQSITSVIYRDSNGTPQTLSGSLYALDNSDDNSAGYVVPAYGSEWPATRDEINAVKVRYVAGYADAAAVPASIKNWIKIMVGSMYEFREEFSNKEVSRLRFVDSLLDRYKVYTS